MAEKLDYAPAPEKQPETPADRVLKLVLIIGLAMLAITSLLLDGGRMFAISALLISILLIILSVISIATGATANWSVHGIANRLPGCWPRHVGLVRLRNANR